MKSPFVIALVAAAALAAGAHVASDAASAPGTSFTAAQATAGAKTFAANCASCHGAKLQGVSAPSLVGPASGLSTSDVHDAYTFISTQMPAGNPGSLSTKEYTDVTAFILQKNGHKPGAVALTPAIAKKSTLKVWK